MTGEQHERAVEAATDALPNVGPGGLGRWSPMNKRLQAQDAIDAYHRSLAEQGVRLVDLREVVKMLRARGNLHAAKALERRFGGREGDEPRSRG